MCLTYFLAFRTIVVIKGGIDGFLAMILEVRRFDATGHRMTAVGDLELLQCLADVWTNSVEDRFDLMEEFERQRFMPNRAWTEFAGINEFGLFGNFGIP